MRFRVIACLAAALCAAAAGQSFAHHSMSAYEFFSTTIEGSVVEFKFVNPHALLVVQSGKETWHLDGDPPAMLDRAGFGPATFHPGDKIKLQVQRLKNGKPGGFWDIRTVITVNGQPFAGHQCVISREPC